jgi:hypothetical protein
MKQTIGERVFIAYEPQTKASRQAAASRLIGDFKRKAR